MKSTAPVVPNDVDWSRIIGAALEGVGVRSVFQPIVDLSRRVIVGYEALTRFDVPTTLRIGPDRCFEQANVLGVGAELEAVTMAKALEHRASLPRNCFLTLNVDPVHLMEPSVRDVLVAEGPLDGLVMEFTEHRAYEWAALESSIRSLREAGALIALDDAGSGYSGLQQILTLRPSLLKLDRSLISGIDRDHAKSSLVEMIGRFAGHIDAWIVAEGVETLAEARRLSELKVPLVQGYLFARPAEPWCDLDADVVAALGDDRYLGHTGLHRLVDPLAPVRWGDDRIIDGLDPTDPWRAVVDADRRPLGVVNAEAVIHGQTVPTLIANVHCTARDLARRLSTSLHEPRAPIVVTDDRGRYLGVITLRRLLVELGTDPTPD